MSNSAFVSVITFVCRCALIHGSQRNVVRALCACVLFSFVEPLAATAQGSNAVFAELYDLRSDAIETTNLAKSPEHQAALRELAAQLREHQRAVSFQLANTLRQAGSSPHEEPKIPATPPRALRTDIQISGVYPHLTTYGIYSQNGAHYKGGHRECGIGAIVPWAGKLWMVNYAPHQPKGSEHKLYSVDPDLNKPMTVHPESVGAHLRGA